MIQTRGAARLEEQFGSDELEHAEYCALRDMLDRDIDHAYDYDHDSNRNMTLGPQLCVYTGDLIYSDAVLNAMLNNAGSLR